MIAPTNLAPDLIITTVHGTWATKKTEGKAGTSTPWYHETSVFAHRLKGRFAEQGTICLLRHFEWSGENSILARYRASRRLSEQVKTMEKRYPGSRHLLIGHSHGGNVALMAATRLPRQGVNPQVVTMSTPFILLRETSYLDKNKITAILFLTMTLLMSTGNIITNRWDSILIASIGLFMTLSAAIIAFNGHDYITDRFHYSKTNKIIKPNFLLLRNASS
jgi:lipase (class 3)